MSETETPPDAPSSEAPAPQAPLRSSLRARWTEWLAPSLAAATAVGVTLRAHLHFMIPFATPVSNDEGYIAAMALRMMDGHWLPYVDAVSQRGPVLYWLATLAMRVGGRFSWVPMRALGLTMALSTLLLVALLSSELAGWTAAAGALLYCTHFLSYELNPWDGIGFNGEIVAMQFALASMLLAVRAQRREGITAKRRDRLVLLAGVSAALAGLTKQMTLIHLAPTFAWLVLGREGDSPSARRRDAVRFLLGVSAPYVVVVAIYALSGHLREFVYYYQRYGRDIFMDPLTTTVMRDKIREQVDRYFLGIAGVSALGLTVLARAVRTYFDAEGARAARLREAVVPLYIVVQLVAAAVGAGFTWRFFPHYFVQVHPIAAVLAGVAVAQLFAARRARDVGAAASATVFVAGAAVLLLVGSSALARNVRTRRETDRWYQDPHADPIVRYVREKTEEGQRIFVWGFRAETYVSAHRLPASRYVYTVYPAGVVPWFQATRDEEERRAVPGSRELLLADLEHYKPELVIDAGRSMNGRYMYNYPPLRNYLDRNYCFMRYVDGEPVYRRRHGAQCPPADY
ncbi:MAG: glycosyltransferase family 39 protein [Polyangiales bacterium]